MAKIETRKSRASPGFFVCYNILIVSENKRTAAKERWFFPNQKIWEKNILGRNPPCWSPF